MDPDACLRDLLDALRNEDRREAQLRLDDLAEWLAKGGFLPKDPRAGPQAALATADHLRVAAEALLTTATQYEQAATRAAIHADTEAAAVQHALRILNASNEEIIAAAVASGEDIDLLVSRVQAMIARKITPTEG